MTPYQLPAGSAAEGARRLAAHLEAQPDVTITLTMAPDAPGFWHVIQGDDGRYAPLWVSDDGDIDTPRERWLGGMYLLRRDADTLANAANLLIGDDPTGERSAALRLIVEAMP